MIFLKNIAELNYNLDSILDNSSEWILDKGPRVVLVLIVIWLINNISQSFISRIVKSAIKHTHTDHQAELDKREQTIVGIIAAVIRIAVWVIGIMIILGGLGVDVAPLLASASVLGFALGFGAQNLVKDFLAGLFIILENQYRVGDVVMISSVSGVVEDITLRTTVLRDLDGHRHHISNGTIEISTNKTIEYSSINLDIGVSYSEDIDKVEKVINKIGATMAEDEKWENIIVKAPEFLRVEDFSDSSIIIKIMGRTVPGQQWAASGELRRRIKKGFDKNSIEIPFPQRVVHEAKSKKK